MWDIEERHREREKTDVQKERFPADTALFGAKDSGDDKSEMDIIIVVINMLVGVVSNKRTKSTDVSNT